MALRVRVYLTEQVVLLDDCLVLGACFLKQRVIDRKSFNAFQISTFDR